MDTQEWLAYYQYKAERPMIPEKRQEMVDRCGGLLVVETIDPKTAKVISRPETYGEAFNRLLTAIRALPRTTPRKEEVRQVVKEELANAGSV